MAAPPDALTRTPRPPCPLPARRSPRRTATSRRPPAPTDAQVKTENEKERGDEENDGIALQPFFLSSGIILHPTSLPSPYGVGDVGPPALRALDWMATAGLTAWQVLPLVPPETQYWSPYVGLDARAGFPLLLSPDALLADGLVSETDVAQVKAAVKGAHGAKVDYPRVAAAKAPLLKKAATALPSSPLAADAAAWRAANPWVEDSALFAALAAGEEGCVDRAWWEWPEPLRFRDGDALAAARDRHAAAVDEYAALQFMFDRQWGALKKHANERGIAVIGDMPIYVGAHSADVWSNRRLFQLDPATGAPARVSGVPPDAFSATGQLWGSPLYDWGAHEAEGYAWWSARLARAAALFDLTRVDHFRGFAGYWDVPATAATAMEGAWVAGPGRALFDAVRGRVGDVPIVAEDLGVITPDVTALRESLGAPGMAVLQFAWGSDAANPHLPHNVGENCAIYTGKEKGGKTIDRNASHRIASIETTIQPSSFPPLGTHDNDTTVGWYASSTSPRDRAALAAYLGPSAAADPAWTLLRAALASRARLALFPLQDVLRLPTSARMNFPGTAGDANWTWRADEGVWEGAKREAKDLRALCSLFGRLPPGVPETDAADAPAWRVKKPGLVRQVAGWVKRKVVG